MGLIDLAGGIAFRCNHGPVPMSISHLNPAFTVAPCLITDKQVAPRIYREG
jgi:hypothetical protein